MSFMTLFTDASVRPLEFKAQVAWIGKTDGGSISGSKEIPFTKDTTIAELKAVREGIAYSLVKFPELKGFLVVSDCMEAVRCFRPGYEIRPELENTINEIIGFLKGRWIKTRYVKAHTGRTDSMSHYNRLVDKHTRTPVFKKIKETVK